MEPIKDQSATALGISKLRYPLRSAGKSKEERSVMADSLSSSASKRGRPPSVSKSVSVLDLSGKNKSAKPPRRLSIPSKSTISPCPATVGSITPISETRMRKLNAQGKSDTPVSDVSRSTSRRKFNVLSSVSYWLSQIKLSESASKHSISLGFFKLALESGCEPFQRVREELISYANRHNLVGDLGEPAKELLQSYNIVEDFEQLHISKNSSELPKDGSQTADEDVHSSCATRSGNLKPKSLNSETLHAATTDKKDSSQKRVPAAKIRASYNQNPVNPVAVGITTGNIQKKSQKHGMKESNQGNGKSKNATKKSTSEKVDPLPTEVPQEDKENTDAQQMEETTSFKDEIQTS